MHIALDKPSKENGQYNQGRTHSVIALSSPENGLMQVVSYPNNNKPPRIETYDLYAQ